MRGAAAQADVGAIIYAGRKYPGLCESESCTVTGDDVELFRDRAWLNVAHVECRACGRRWKMVGE